MIIGKCPMTYQTMMRYTLLAFGVKEAKTWFNEFRANAPLRFTMNEFSFLVSSVYGRNVVASNHTKLNRDNLC